MRFEDCPDDPDKVRIKMNEYCIPKPWVGLHGIEIRMLKETHIPLYSTPSLDDYLNFARAIEVLLKEKNSV